MPVDAKTMRSWYCPGFLRIRQFLARSSEIVHVAQGFFRLQRQNTADSGPNEFHWPPYTSLHLSCGDKWNGWLRRPLVGEGLHDRTPDHHERQAMQHPRTAASNPRAQWRPEKHQVLKGTERSIKREMSTWRLRGTLSSVSCFCIWDLSNLVF